nr:chaperonin CPN60-2, mitochondrial [Tanacetum cinerariifolium]
MTSFFFSKTLNQIKVTNFVLLIHKIGQYANIVKEEIIDPLKVIRTALVDVGSVSSLLTTTEAVIVESPKDEKDSLASGLGPI